MVKGDTEDYEEGENPILFSYLEGVIDKWNLHKDNIEEFLPKFIRDLNINMTTKPSSQGEVERSNLHIYRTPFDSGTGIKSSSKKVNTSIFDIY